MKKFQIYSAIFLSGLFPSLSYGDLLWNCRSDLVGTSAFERYIHVQYGFWSGKFKSVTISFDADGTHQLASAGSWLSEERDGSRQIVKEGIPGAALDVRVYKMSQSIFDLRATQGTLIEIRNTNFATTEIVYQCTLN